MQRFREWLRINEDSPYDTTGEVGYGWSSPTGGDPNGDSGRNDDKYKSRWIKSKWTASMKSETKKTKKPAK